MPRPALGQFWERFPKFVLGFIAASVIGTWYLQWAGGTARRPSRTVNDLRTWFLIFAFVSIGLEFPVASLREAGWRPIAVFACATVVQPGAGARAGLGAVRRFRRLSVAGGDGVLRSHHLSRPRKSCGLRPKSSRSRYVSVTEFAFAVSLPPRRVLPSGLTAVTTAS